MKKLQAWTILIIVSLLISVSIHGAVAALTESQMQMFSQNDIFFYDPSCVKAQKDNCVGLLPGNDNAELIWNYFIEAGINGVSNNANVIAGILGNLQQESGLNPFSAGNYYGLFQTNDASFMESMKNASLDTYWGSDSAPRDAVEKAIKIELDWLTKNSDRFKCAGTWQKTGFVCNINGVANTPEAFSDLFLVSYEGAHTDDAESPHAGGSNAILDAHARQVGYEILGKYSYYQEASTRRANAKAIYDKYSSAVTCKSSQSLVDAAKRLSWPVGARPTDIYTATNDYDKAALARGDGFVTASNCSRQSAAGVCYSCSRYVSLALLESGIDQDFIEQSKDGNHFKPHLLDMSPGGLTYYLVNSPKWQELTNYNGIGYDQLKPGDILLKDTEYGGDGDHVFIYLGNGIVAEASNSNFSAYQHEWSSGNNGFKAFRFKNSASSSSSTSQNQSSSTSTSLNEGGINSIMRAKNADKQSSDFIRPQGVANGGQNIARWDDNDSPEMLKALLEAYGDLAYQVGRAINIPWVSIIVQMRYEDPNSLCGKNNFWGNGCLPGTAEGNASIQSGNLGDGFVEYAKTVTNGYHNQALGIKDAKEFLVKIGPTWVQGNINDHGYSDIESMKRSVDVLEDFIETSEGQAVVRTFGNWSNEGKNICGSEATGTCFASQLKDESDGGCTKDGFTYYWQGGNTWGNQPYACELISNAACGPTAMAMIITALTGKMVTPDESAAKASALGAATCGEGSYDRVALIAKEYGLTVESIPETAEAINQVLKQGKMVITSVGPESRLTTINHFIGIRTLTSSGKWKLFDSSPYYDGGLHQDINDIEFDPQFLANAISVHGGGSYAISK